VHGLRGCTREAVNWYIKAEVVRIGEDTARFLLISRAFAPKILRGVDEEISEMWKEADTIHEIISDIEADDGYDSPYWKERAIGDQWNGLQELIKFRKRIEKISDVLAGTFMSTEHFEQRRTARRNLAKEKDASLEISREEEWLVSKYSDSN